jgi:hypothetical protein
MYFFIDRIYLKSIGELIHRKDKRSIRRWCTKNHLQMFKDSSGEFVYSNDFDLAYDSPLILKLKAKYKDGWMDYYEAYNKDELLKMLAITTISTSSKSSYIPKGKITMNTLKK